MVKLISGATADGGQIALTSAGLLGGPALLLLLVAILVGFVALAVHLVRRWRRRRAGGQIAGGPDTRTLVAHD